MKYYLLSNSAEKKVVGHFFQTSGLIDNYDENSENSMTKLTSTSFPNFKPDLRFQLSQKAKLTDVVSASNINAQGFLINERAKKIFKEFSIIPHKYYEAFLKVKEKYLDYYWLHLVKSNLDGVDFTHSKFIETDYFDIIANLEIKNQGEYFQKQSASDNFIFANKIVLTKEWANLRYDLLYFPYIQKSGKYFASENFINKILKENLTGLLIEDQTILE